MGEFEPAPAPRLGSSRRSGLKLQFGLSDFRVIMGIADLSCPICSADFPLSGEEKPGDEVFCAYCGAPCRLKGDPYSEGCEIEEDI